MKAMIFAAGLGTRLKPLTHTMPKAMIPVAGKPMLQHVVEKLKCEGFDEIIINVHHFPEHIKNFVKENDSFGIRIEFSDETEELLETGGGIKKAQYFFDDGKPFLIHNVDILSNISLRDFYQHHLNSTNIATLLVSERQTQRYFLFKENLLNGWINKKTGEIKSPFSIQDASQYRHLAFSGMHIISPDIFRYMDDFPARFSIVDFYLEVCKKENIGCFIPKDFRIVDVGKLDTLHEAEEFVKTLDV